MRVYRCARNSADCRPVHPPLPHPAPRLLHPRPRSLAEGGRCTQPCATPGRICVLEERDPVSTLRGNIERIVRLIATKNAFDGDRTQHRSNLLVQGMRSRMRCFAKVVDRDRLLTLRGIDTFCKDQLARLLCDRGTEVIKKLVVWKILGPMASLEIKKAACNETVYFNDTVTIRSYISSFFNETLS